MLFGRYTGIAVYEKIILDWKWRPVSATNRCTAKPYFTLTLLSSSALSLHQSHFLSFVLDRSSLITSTARAKHFSFLCCRQTLASHLLKPSRHRSLRQSAAQRKATAAPQFPLYHFPFRLRCVLAESRRASFIQCGLQSCAEASTK